MIDSAAFAELQTHLRALLARQAAEDGAPPRVEQFDCDIAEDFNHVFAIAWDGRDRSWFASARLAAPIDSFNHAEWEKALADAFNRPALIVVQ